MGDFPTRMLLATDGSEDAALALRAAVDISRRTGSELHLVHVWRATPSYAHPAMALATDSEYYEQRAQELLMGQLDKLVQAGAEVSGAHLRRGRPAEEIVALAEELGSGLLVLGSRGLGTVKRLVLGSVSEEVVSHCRRPTLVMQGGDGSWPPETMIVGDDGSTEARKAAEIGVRLASLSGAEATLVRASFPPPSYPTSEWSQQSDLREREALAREWELHRVENIVRKTALKLESETSLRPKVQAVEGEAATAVLESAEEAGASTLIAIGRRGLGKVQRTVLGSVSTKILRASHVPVLVCR
jgi:nucleotide-binding universal stress UspA family protein